MLYIHEALVFKIIAEPGIFEEGKKLTYLSLLITKHTKICFGYYFSGEFGIYTAFWTDHLKRKETFNIYYILGYLRVFISLHITFKKLNDIA